MLERSDSLVVQKGMCVAQHETRLRRKRELERSAGASRGASRTFPTGTFRAEG